MPKKKKAAEEAPEDKTPEKSEWIFEEEGVHYDGEWVTIDNAAVRQGYGTNTEHGTVYVGEFKEDKMHGKGKITYSNGSYYDGEWNNNKYEGQGTYCWTDGSWYEGQWKDNKMHGKGTYHSKDGRSWHGEFYNGNGPGLEMNVDIL
eukprot:gb/GECH01008130.1/.p1 GENE.gb/GECH01008130.1/~~gb/GECH01008130.1/.p1  ORF type:complete len:146 (+),score=41.61 gb/GECH01008130.1/:1-438(+)